MKFPFLFLLALLPSWAIAQTYTVQRGDSLWALAEKFDLSPGIIRKVNDLAKDQLYPGQKLFLPKEVLSYTVKKGDSLEKIAKSFQSTPARLVLLNNLEDESLSEGQILKVPLAKESNGPAAKIHTVASGENLSGIALKYKISLSSLRALNDKISDQLFVGEKLIVEGAKASPEPRITVATNVKAHLVQANQTLGGIAIRYKVSEKDIMAWNNRKTPTIYRGESLKILSFGKPMEQAKTPSPAEAPARTLIHTVKRGESLLALAGRYGVKVSEIKSWNNKSRDSIQVGERLKIRAEEDADDKIEAKPAARTKPVIYTVRRGDTLDSIASRHQVSRSTLMAANRKKNTAIFVGEKLKFSVPVPDRPSPVLRASNSERPSAPPPLQGIRSPRFSGIPLPVASSELKTAAPSGRGVDIYLKSRSQIKAPSGGIIEYAGYINALQNVIILKLPEDRTLIYAGLGDISVKAGQEVSRGEILGRAGYNALEDSAKIYMEMRDKSEVANAFHSYKDLEKYVKK